MNNLQTPQHAFTRLGDLEELLRDQPEVETKFTVTVQEPQEVEICELNFLALI